MLIKKEKIQKTTSLYDLLYTYSMGNVNLQEKGLHVGAGLFITISYLFTDQEKNMLGSSEHSGDYVFLFGAGDTIPGLEKHLEGAEVGETRKFVIPAKDAYGVYNADLNHTLPRSSFPQELELKVGRPIYVNDKQMNVIGLDETTVSVDENHPLAGKELHFTTNIISIQEENEQSSCCGGGGCSCKGDQTG